MTRHAYLSTVTGALLVLLNVNVCADTLVADLPLKVKDKVPQKAYAFNLRDVRLLDSPFKTAMDLDARYLLSLDADRFLARYREFAGLKPKAPTYGGWETATISGHSLGHYLTAISKLYASTADKRLLDRINYIIDELAECQNAWANGFVGAFPRSREVFDEIKAGNIRSAGFDLNGIWVPWYNLHKLYMGLADARLYCGNEKAVDILKKSTDWAWSTVGDLTDEQFETMLHCEHGGINEAFAEIYAITGYDKALKLAQRFYHHRVLDPLTRRQDNLTGLHSNTQIPKLIGLARLYRLTADERYNTASVFFWETVVRKRTYANGGNTDGEYFFPPQDFSKHLSIHTTETCNTYNMLKLTRRLFAMDPRAEYADYYERALYNHILASQDPNQGMMIYFCPLKSGHFKTYNTPFDSFWCCTGTGMENHVKYADSIFFYDDNTLYVNLFIPSVLNFRQKGLTLTQQTLYPLNGAVNISLDTDNPLKLNLKIRRPHWAADDVKVTVNGKPHPVTASPGDYIALDRTWKTGDQINLIFPMKVRTEAMPDNTGKVAFFYGPILLAGALGKEGIENLDPHAEERAKFDHIPAPLIPVLVAGDSTIQDYIRPTDEPGTFIVRSSVLKTPGFDKTDDIALIPFYKMHYQRYIVYWDLFTEQQWKQAKELFEAEQAEIRALEARTIDRIVLGQMQPERDHNLKGDNTHAGIFQNRHWRDARSGGWFSFEMKVLPDSPVKLACLYWGSDGPGRDFDILIDDTKIATERLNQNQPGRFFTVTYDIPPELTRGKTAVTVKLQAHPWRTAGGLFESRIIEAGTPDDTEDDAPAPDTLAHNRRNVTFIVTSDVHYDAFENEDRNDRVRDTLKHVNEIANIEWPKELGGGLVQHPEAVLILGDVIDDGDRILHGKHQTPRQWLLFQADFGLDGTDGLLDYPVYETWGNHDGPPEGKDKHGFSFQAHLKARNQIRKDKGWLTNVSPNGLHYSWDWGDVHFAQLGIYPADSQHPNIRYDSEWHDPQEALAFLRNDLAASVADSGRPVVLTSHCGFDTDWWHEEDWKTLYETTRHYDVILYLYGHSGTGFRNWAPTDDDRPLRCVNTGQTENGFFVVQITDSTIRLAYRCKNWLHAKTPEGKTTRSWDGTWQWKHLLQQKLTPYNSSHSPVTSPQS